MVCRLSSLWPKASADVAHPGLDVTNASPRTLFEPSLVATLINPALVPPTSAVTPDRTI